MKLLPAYPECFISGDNNKFGLNISFYRKEDSVIASGCISEQYAGYPGIVHGGMIASLLDEVMGRIVSSILKKMVVTARISVSYHRPLPTTIFFLATGIMVENQRQQQRLWKAKGRLVGDSGILYAAATGEFFPLPEERYPQILEHLKISKEQRKVSMEDI